jgi:hypothetical protein
VSRTALIDGGRNDETDDGCCGACDLCDVGHVASGGDAGSARFDGDSVGATWFGGIELDSRFYGSVPSGSGRFTVDLSTAVFKSPSGTLDFYYQVASKAGRADDIRRLSTSLFEGALTDLYQIANGSSVPCAACPAGTFKDGTQGAAVADRSINGAVVGWRFEPPGPAALQPGETTRVFVIRTDATAYRRGFMFVINGRVVLRAAFGV